MMQANLPARRQAGPWLTTLTELAASMAGGLVLLAFAVSVG